MNYRKTLEAIADIAYVAGERKYFSGDSRADISNFIFWAKEFQKEHLKTNWDDVDYITSIVKFTDNKLKGS